MKLDTHMHGQLHKETDYMAKFYIICHVILCHDMTICHDMRLYNFDPLLHETSRKLLIN